MRLLCCQRYGNSGNDVWEERRLDKLFLLFYLYVFFAA